MGEVKPNLIGFIANSIMTIFGIKKKNINEQEMIDFIIKTTKYEREEVVKILDAQYLFHKIKVIH